jgi:hypothetical protein
MAEYPSVLSLTEIEKQNQLLYELHRNAEHDALEASYSLKAVDELELQTAFRALSRTRKIARQAFEASKEFYEVHKDGLHELALAEN